jgi:hypothetical protein
MGAHAPLGLGQPENGVIVGNAYVAGQRQLESPGHGRSVDCGNDRFVGFVNHLEHEPFLRRHEIHKALASLVCVPPGLKVSAATKGPIACAGNDNGPHFRVGSSVDECFNQRRHEFR